VKEKNIGIEPGLPNPDQRGVETQKGLFKTVPLVVGFRSLAVDFVSFTVSFVSFTAGFVSFTAGFASLTAGFGSLTAGFGSLAVEVNLPKIT